MGLSLCPPCPKNLSEKYHKEEKKVPVLFATIWTIHETPNDNSMCLSLPFAKHNWQRLCVFAGTHRTILTCGIIQPSATFVREHAKLWVRARAGPCHGISQFSSFGCSLHHNSGTWSKSRARWWKLPLPILPRICPSCNRTALSFPPFLPWTGSLCICLRVWFAFFFKY